MKKSYMVSGKQEYKIDIPVLIIFFNRDELLQKVFDEIKEARPSKLYLYQDGARKGNENDIDGIMKCRKIVEDINWNCEVSEWFQEENVGCDPSEYLAQKWLFSNEEMGIVLEDDDVPSQSFFPYCKDLLEQYKNDERINMICGANNCGVLKNRKTSYVFSRLGHCTGWASWKRVVDLWDENYSWLDDKYTVECLQGKFHNKSEYRELLRTCERHKSSGIAYYETVGGMDLYLYNRVNIVPTHNMISNIGYGVSGTHSAGDLRILPSKIAKWANAKRYEIEFPLVHPEYCIPDLEFEKGITFSRLERLMMKVEMRLKQLRYYGPLYFTRKVKGRINGK